MNPRIKELMEQARITSTAIDPFNKMPYEYTHFSEEKFAELIVRECADLANEGFGQANFGLGIKGRNLKEHFGVKE